MQPLSKMDETTNKGAGVVLISQMVMFGILKLTGDQGTEGNLNDLELEDGWEERTMMFVGDGLTMARMKSFDELLNTNIMGHEKQYEKAQMLNTIEMSVLSAVIYPTSQNTNEGFSV